MQNKEYKNLIEYLIDVENLTFREASKISEKYDDLDEYIKKANICENVRIAEIDNNIFSIVFENEKGTIIYGAEFSFDNNDIFDYMHINDLEYLLNEHYNLLSSEDIAGSLFEEIEEKANDLILEDEGSIYKWDHVDYVNEHGGLFECLKGACCEYDYNIADIADENTAYSIAYSWAYNNEKPSACLAYLQKEDY